MWLTVALALGFAIGASASFLYFRRRERRASLDDDATVRTSGPRRIVDPLAGYEVVQGQLGSARAPAEHKPAPPSRATAPINVRAPVARVEASGVHSLLETEAVKSVDLDVGAPAMVHERVDWFADRAAADAAAPTESSAADDTIESAATARIEQQQLEATADLLESTFDDDRQHTLTITELDMLREDYEAEHTLTQTGSKELRDAIADLKATQEARAASASTAKLERPEPRQAEPVDTQKTRKLRSSRR
jgi:hypothetical protein